jgi:hypothetical protein
MVQRTTCSYGIRPNSHRNIRWCEDGVMECVSVWVWEWWFHWVTGGSQLCHYLPRCSAVFWDGCGQGGVREARAGPGPGPGPVAAGGVSPTTARGRASSPRRLGNHSLTHSLTHLTILTLSLMLYYFICLFCSGLWMIYSCRLKWRNLLSQMQMYATIPIPCILWCSA